MLRYNVSNTGIHSGACTLLEKKLSKLLYYFPCRHHILEIIVSTVYKICFGPSSGPDIQLFKRFQEKWNFIDEQTFSTISSDSKYVNELLDETKSFLKQVESRECQPRDDYRELLELCLICLG